MDSSRKLTLQDVQPFGARTFDNTFEAADVPTATGYAAPRGYTPTGLDTVQGQMDSLLNKNSAYMQNARKTGERMAHSRGLLNSGLASEYSQKAAIESSLPIAQQDAGQRFQSGMAQQEGRIQGALAKQSYGNEANLMNLQSQNTAGLDTMRAGFESGLLAQKGEQERLNIDYELDKRFAHDEKMLEMYNAHQKAMQEMSQLHDVTMEELSSQNRLYHDKAIQEIQNNHDLARDERLASYKLAHDTTLTEINNRHDLTILEKQTQANLALETAIAGIMHDNNLAMADKMAAINMYHDEAMANINANLQMTADERRDARQNAHDVVMENLVTDNRMNLAEFQSALDTTMQTTMAGIMNDHEASLMDKKAGIDLNYAKVINQIETQSHLSAMDKQSAIDQLLLQQKLHHEELQGQFDRDHQATLARMEMDGLLDRDAMRYDFEAQQSTIDRAHDKSRYMFEAQADQRIAELNADTGLSIAELNAQTDQILAELNIAHEHGLTEMNNAARLQIEQIGIDSAMQRQIVSSVNGYLLELQNEIYNIQTGPYGDSKGALIEESIRAAQSNIDNLVALSGYEVEYED